MKVKLICSLTLITGPTFAGPGHGKVVNNTRSPLRRHDGTWLLASVYIK